MVQKGSPGDLAQYTWLEGYSYHYSYPKGTGTVDSAKAGWERVMDREVFRLRSEGAVADVTPRLSVARSQPLAEQLDLLEVEYEDGMDLVLRCLDPIVKNYLVLGL